MIMHGLSAPDYCYPVSFVSNNDEILVRLRMLSNNTLLDSVCGFSANISSVQRTKAGLVRLIMDDFSQQTKELVRFSTKELYNLASPPTDFPRLQLLLVCQLVHKWYGPIVAPKLLCGPTRWNPPEVMGDDATVPSANWLQVPIDGDHLKSRLSKVDSSVIKACCDLYLSPDPIPKSKTGRYSAIAKRFRRRSLFLFHLSDVELLKNYFALIPYNLPTLEAPRRHLVEEMLKEDFGCEISDQLLLPPLSERIKEKHKGVRRANQKCSIADARATRDAYIRSWPQPVLKDVVLNCLNMYYEATKLKTPLTCCVCSRQQLEVEIHETAGHYIPITVQPKASPYWSLHWSIRFVAIQYFFSRTTQE